MVGSLNGNELLIIRTHSIVPKNGKKPVHVAHGSMAATLHAPQPLEFQDVQATQVEVSENCVGN